jgi:hypothetical protein
MNFYYQTGEFLSDGGSQFIEPMLTLLGIVVGAWMAIGVFKMEKKHERDSELTRLKNLKVYVKNAIESLTESIEKQITSLQEFSTQLALPKDQNYTPQKMVTLHSKRIRWIKPSDLHEIFVNSTSNIEVNSDKMRLFDSDLDYIDSVESSLDELFNLFQKKKDQYLNVDYNTSMKLMVQVKDRLGVEYDKMVAKKETFRYPFLETFHKLMIDWGSMDDYKEHDVALEKFLKPALQLCRNAGADHNASTLINFINDAIYALENNSELKSFIKDGVDFKIEKLKTTRINVSTFYDLHWPKK